ncbi:Plavaka transposase-domain containing protein [Phanerochaete sordida]|uniref:Plavaka transposase-domain containing protein n=1 Tax=Phanerochaete sordida TaxID=48140 RepID=A0A9P3FZD8_9APHY|nr:Plavaka transposase-domain containing protein [Phanerochaete sordida]
MDVDEDAEAAPVAFEGDFFGANYRAEDLPGWADEDSESDQGCGPGRKADGVEKDSELYTQEDPGDDSEAELVERMEALRPMWEPAVVQNAQLTQTTQHSADSVSDSGRTQLGSTLAEVADPGEASNSTDVGGSLAGASHADRPPQDSVEPSSPMPIYADSLQRKRMENALRRTIHAVRFPSARAGAPIDPPVVDATAEPGSEPQTNSSPQPQDAPKESESAKPKKNIYAPFANKTEWELARWSKMRGPGSNAFNELLEIEGIQQKLGLTFQNTREVNALVDTLPSTRPRFVRDEIVVDQQAFDVYFRDVIACIRSLYGEPDFAQHLVFLPERHYSDPDHTKRLYHDMHTGKWWWAAQKAVEANAEGGTIIPVILSSDKTQLTLFRNKAAYPVYLTIGNIPKDIRSKPSRGGHILLAYLPTSKLEHITSKAARRRAQANLFHACMRRILGALEDAGLNGLPMTSGDGVTRRVHPIYAAYVGDYPEQVLVTCTKYGECPVCTQPRSELGDYDPGIDFPLRDLSKVLDVLEQVDDLSRARYSRKCKAVGIKPIYKPFWESLPYSDVFLSIAPDILHQLLQGVVKHLVSWLKDVYDEDEIDARCRRFPPNHNVRLFFKGITKLSRLTGTEHADICRILLGLVIDLRPGDGISQASQLSLVRAVRAMLDFVYLAQYPIHSMQTLDALDDALARFHENKSVFVDLGIRSDFHFPKLHFCRHYRERIENLGSADNYNTEYTERLHIDMAKDAYRATNKKDEYDQMTVWLERKEKVIQYDRHIKARELEAQADADDNPAPGTENNPAPCPPSDPGPRTNNLATGSAMLRPSTAATLNIPREPTQASLSVQPAALHDTIGRTTGRPSSYELQPLYRHSETHILMTRDPSAKAVPFHRLHTQYGAVDFELCLAQFVARYNHPEASPRSLAALASNIRLRFDKVRVYHKAKFWEESFARYRHASDNHDVIHATPPRLDKRGDTIPGRFDTALINLGSGKATGVAGYRIGQVRAIFTIPPRYAAKLFPAGSPPDHLVYVEWFTKFARPNTTHGLYKVERSFDGDGKRSAEVRLLSDVRRSVHLWPNFGPIAPRHWTSANVLDEATKFWYTTWMVRHGMSIDPRHVMLLGDVMIYKDEVLGTMRLASRGWRTTCLC